MMCDVIVYFVVVFTDGHKEARVRWVNHKNTKTLVGQLTKPEELKKYDINLYNVEDIKISVVKPFDCSKGPANEAPAKR